MSRCELPSLSRVSSAGGLSHSRQIQCFTAICINTSPCVTGPGGISRLDGEDINSDWDKWIPNLLQVFPLKMVMLCLCLEDFMLSLAKPSSFGCITYLWHQEPRQRRSLSRSGRHIPSLVDRFNILWYPVYQVTSWAESVSPDRGYEGLQKTTGDLSHLALGGLLATCSCDLNKVHRERHHTCRNPRCGCWDCDLFRHQ